MEREVYINEQALPLFLISLGPLFPPPSPPSSSFLSTLPSTNTSPPSIYSPILKPLSTMKEEAIIDEKLQYEEEKRHDDPEHQVVLNEEDDSPIEEVRVTVSSK